MEDGKAASWGYDVEIINNKDENITINRRKSSTLRGNIRV